MSTPIPLSNCPIANWSELYSAVFVVYFFQTSVEIQNREYLIIGYHDKHPVIQWFWKAVDSVNNEQRLRLLQVCSVLFILSSSACSQLEVWNENSFLFLARDQFLS